MRNSKITLPTLSIAILMVIASFSSCKPKKLIAQAPPVPVETPAQETPKPAPAPESDSDGDGIPDSKDNCPNKAGTAENNGCPEVVAPEPTFNYKNILFEFNSSVLKTSSYPTLDQISREMKKYPNMKFILNGHSSAEGSEARNMTLSIDRATAVKSYLISAGIDGRSLETKGFGESMPLNTNNNEEGRQLNRRVEIKKF
jgi:outer membrane protein OmpA-like peptidoglycan-associated protein